MSGNYAKPYRPAPTGSVIYSHPNHLSGCDVIPKHANLTQVWEAAFTNGVDSSGGFTYTKVAPQARIGQYSDSDGTPTATECSGLPPGNCGPWLAQSESLGGIASDAVQTNLRDIVPTPAGQINSDHNSYGVSGTIDFRRCFQSGMKPVLGKKYWHGAFGPIDQNDPTGTINGYNLSTSGVGDPTYASGSFNTSAPQTRYRQIDVVFSGTYKVADMPGHILTFTFGSGGTSLVDRYTGILLNTGYTNSAGTIDGINIDSVVANWLGRTIAIIGKSSNGAMAAMSAASSLDYGAFSYDSIVVSGGLISYYYEDVLVDSIDISSSGITRIVYGDGGSGIRVVVTKEVMSFNSNSITYHYTYTNAADSTNTTDYTLTITYSVPYSAVDFKSDLSAAIAAWRLDDDRFYPWRTDEYLAQMPMCCYDEVQGPIPPTVITGAITMNDYSQAQVSGLWVQIPWIDPNSFVWVYGTSVQIAAGNGSVYLPSGFTGGAPGPSTFGAQMITGIRSGAIVSHNPAGYAAHFWFGFQKYKQFQHIGGDGHPDGLTIWRPTSIGGFALAPLPTNSMRWQDDFTAQYDPLLYLEDGSPPWGNLPQSWVRELAGVGYMAKYVETKLMWKSLNFGRPYGLDRWAVDMATVCCDLGGGMRATQGALDPLAPGGLQNGDFVMISGDGVYQLSGIAPTSGLTDTWGSANQFTYTKGTQICGIPVGTDFGAAYPHDTYIARIRFPSAPPFGLMPCTGSWNSSTNITTLSVAATPFWVSISGAPITLGVDLRSADSVTQNPAALVGTNVTVTKINVTDLTITVPDTTGAYAAAKFIIPHLHNSGVQFLPEYDDDTSKGDFVQAIWTFNLRANQTDYPSPPTWYGTSLGNPQAGVLTGTISQQQIKFSPCCPSVVGFVQMGAPEVGPYPLISGFKIQNIQVMSADSTFVADSKFGSFEQYAVYTTMPDPFWQRPFRPDQKGQVTPWNEDDGTGSGNYPHHPIVEARCSLPSNLGFSGTETAPALPSGIAMKYDTSQNVIPPDYWPTGIPCVNGTGGYSALDTAFGFQFVACQNIAGAGNFSNQYKKFVSC